MGNTLVEQGFGSYLNNPAFNKDFQESTFDASFAALNAAYKDPHVENHHPANSSTNLTAVEGVDKSRPSRAHSKNDIDPVILAVLCIMMYVNEQQQTASVQEKQIQANGSAQIKLNNEDAEENFVALTTKQLYKEVKTQVGHWGNPFKGSPIYFYKTKLKKVTVTNAVGINQVQNQEVQKTRDGISNQLILLRQGAQIGETQISSTIDQSQQAVSESSAILQLLTSVTNQILQKQ